MIKYRILGRAGYLARMENLGMIRNLNRKSTEKRLLVRPKRGWEDIIRMDLT